MEIRLDDGTAARIAVPRGKRDVWAWDTETAGLFLRKFSTGRAMFGVKYAVAGRARTVHLRDAGERGSLAAARREAGDVRAMARLNRDLLAERAAAKAAAAAEARRRINTLGKVAADYLAARKKELRPRSYVEVARHIDKNAKPLHGRPIEDITRADIVALIDDVERKSGKVQADKTRISLATMFAWAIDRGHITGTPFVHLKGRGGNVSRDRVLTPAEMRHMWAACDAVDGEGKRLVDDGYARIVKLLLLTGCRREEIGRLAWVEVVEASNMLRVELPSERTKNKRVHWVHLSTLAIALLPTRPGSDEPDARTMAFGKRRHTGFSGWSKGRVQLDAAIAKVRRKAGIKGEMPEWRLHDLRRSFATRAREENLADTHLIELAINHTSGTRGGVAGVYDRSERWDDRVKLFDDWATWIEANIIRQPGESRP
jgi:integrase